MQPRQRSLARHGNQKLSFLRKMLSGELVHLSLT